MSTAERAFVLLVAVVFAPAALALARVWSSVDYYSHGFLVPLVALWTAQQIAARARRRSGQPIAPERDRRGVFAFAAALLLYVAGLAAGSTPLQGLALVAAINAGALYWLGPRRLRAYAFPLLFPLFAVPLPDPVLTPLIVGLQLFVSQAAVAVLDLFSLGVTRAGNVLLLAGGERLFVAEACSGITSIVTLTPLAVMLAYFTERTWPRRLVIVAAVIPVAMLGNLLRVLGTVVAADAFGVDRVTGNPLHDMAGLLTFVLACLALVGLGGLLRRFTPQPG